MYGYETKNCNGLAALIMRLIPVCLIETSLSIDFNPLLIPLCHHHVTLAWLGNTTNDGCNRETEIQNHVGIISAL